MAYEISPEIGRQFWRFTPREFAKIANGYQRRQYDEWLRVAWLICNVSAMFGERNIGPNKLIGKRPEAVTGDVWLR